MDDSGARWFAEMPHKQRWVLCPRLLKKQIHIMYVNIKKHHDGFLNIMVLGSTFTRYFGVYSKHSTEEQWDSMGDVLGVSNTNTWPIVMYTSVSFFHKWYKAAWHVFDWRICSNMGGKSEVSQLARRTIAKAVRVPMRCMRASACQLVAWHCQGYPGEDALTRLE